MCQLVLDRRSGSALMITSDTSHTSATYRDNHAQRLVGVTKFLVYIIMVVICKQNLGNYNISSNVHKLLKSILLSICAKLTIEKLKVFLLE